ncbi:helix-turn-helix domain-containing protein [Methylobacterium aquaticum]|uniref:helix-turn-helix domain-containing protein n=1 Tax=Methylobacterium aquaticum TaxID=270351 RepID=UPI003D163409
MSERPITIRRVAVIVAEDYGSSLALLRGASRRPVDTFPRQVAMYLAHCHLGQSLTEIGRFFDRDHTTVIHAIKVVADKAQADLALKDRLHRLGERINAAEAEILAGAWVAPELKPPPGPRALPPIAVVMAPIEASKDPRVRRVLDAVRGYVESRRALSDAQYSRGEAGARRRVETEYALLDRAYSDFAAGRDRS